MHYAGKRRACLRLYARRLREKIEAVWNMEYEAGWKMGRWKHWLCEKLMLVPGWCEV